MNFVPPWNVRTETTDCVENFRPSLSAKLSVLLPGMGSGEAVRMGAGDGAPDDDADEICVCIFGSVDCGDGD
jgi:hypothetical protein